MTRNRKASNYVNVLSNDYEMGRYLFEAFDAARVRRPNMTEPLDVIEQHFIRLAIHYLHQVSQLYQALLYLHERNKQQGLAHLKLIYDRFKTDAYNEYMQDNRFKMLCFSGRAYLRQDHPYQPEFQMLYADLENLIFADASCIVVHDDLIKRTYQQFFSKDYNFYDYRAMLVFSALYKKFTESEQITQTHLFKLMHDAIAAIFYFDQPQRLKWLTNAKRLNLMQQQFRALRSLLYGMQKSHHADVRLLAKHCLIIWKMVTRSDLQKDSPSDAFAVLFENYHTKQDADGPLNLMGQLHADKQNADRNIWDELPAISADSRQTAADTGVATAETPLVAGRLRVRYQRTWLQATLNVFCLLLFATPIVLLILASKGVFGLVLPWALSKCIAAAATVSTAAAGVIVATDSIIRNWLKSGFKALGRWFQRCFTNQPQQATVEAGATVEPAAAAATDRPLSAVSLESLITVIHDDGDAPDRRPTRLPSVILQPPASEETPAAQDEERLAHRPATTSRFTLVDRGATSAAMFKINEFFEQVVDGFTAEVVAEEVHQQFSNG